MHSTPWRIRPLFAALIALLAVGFVAFAACGADEDADSDTGKPTATGGGTEYSSLSGSIAVDGSSTVGPITEAVAEEFGKVSNVDVSVGISGTGGGFEKFCKGETDINDASRAIKDAEKTACQGGGVEYTEFKVGVDGLTVVVNGGNEFVECLTFSQLKTLWDQGSTVQNWSQVDPSLPAESIKLYGPGPDSGTFDYFTEEVNGKAKQSRSDYTANEDDYTLVRGVENDENALGYFGFAYYQGAAGQLKAVKIDKDADAKGTPVAADKRKGCVEPTSATINDNSYPLSRPLYIYVSRDALARAEVKGFVEFYLDNAKELVEDVGYIPLQDGEYEKGLSTLASS